MCVWVGGYGCGWAVRFCLFVLLFIFVVVIVVLIRVACGVYYLFIWIIWCFGAQMDDMVFRSSDGSYGVSRSSDGSCGVSEPIC